jgi:hypothetical protein
MSVFSEEESLDLFCCIINTTFGLRWCCIDPSNAPGNPEVIDCQFLVGRPTAQIAGDGKRQAELRQFTPKFTEWIMGSLPAVNCKL